MFKINKEGNDEFRGQEDYSYLGDRAFNDNRKPKQEKAQDEDKPKNEISLERQIQNISQRILEVDHQLESINGINKSEIDEKIREASDWHFREIEDNFERYRLERDAVNKNEKEYLKSLKDKHLRLMESIKNSFFKRIENDYPEISDYIEKYFEDNHEDYAHPYRVFGSKEQKEIKAMISYFIEVKKMELLKEKSILKNILKSKQVKLETEEDNNTD